MGSNDNAPHRVAARRAYKATPEGKAAMARARAAYRARQPARRAAHVALGNAVRDGKVVKPPACWCCGSGPVEAHHADYDRPLAVSWLCVLCHKLVHRLTAQLQRARAVA